MSDDTLINLDLCFGSVEIITTERREGNALVLGGYSITRDRHGREVSRTEDRETCRMTNYFEIYGPQPKTWWQRLLGY